MPSTTSHRQPTQPTQPTTFQAVVKNFMAETGASFTTINTRLTALESRMSELEETNRRGFSELLVLGFLAFIHYLLVIAEMLSYKIVHAVIQAQIHSQRQVVQ